MPGGQRRDRDWVGPISSADKLLAWQNANRAFTSHEQLDNLGLIHMNGRVYDPGIGRFLSADPFVSDAFNLQALNRYSYVLNNPLSLFDPSGFTPQLPGDDEDPFPSDDCGYDIFCSPPGGGARFPGHQPPIFTPPFGVGPDEQAAVDIVMGANPSGVTFGSTRPTLAEWGAIVDARIGDLKGSLAETERLREKYSQTPPGPDWRSFADTWWPGYSIGSCIYFGCSDTGWISGSLGSFPGGKGLTFARAGLAARGAKALPALDRTGKVHGALPLAEDLGRYSRDELRQLQQDLRQSVQQRIRTTSELGPDRAHGQRQAAEQQLITQIEKYLSGS